MPQPYGTPAPWPNGDGGLSELGPNTGIRMKAVTMLAGTLLSTLAGIEDFEIAQQTVGRS